MIDSRIVLAIPVAQGAAKQASENFALWRMMGYRTVAYVEYPQPGSWPENCEVVCGSQYLGWAWATNLLARRLAGQFDWLIAAGHDVQPHREHRAQAIAAECKDHFNGTYGVMQPAGDQYGAIVTGEACVSPWIGADFCAKHGPLHDGYYHFWADSEILHVARMNNCLWWREDLTQYHDHHARKPNAKGHPDYLKPAAKMNSADKELFLQRKAAGFPHCSLKSVHL